VGGRRGSGSMISGRDGADRFVMGLLRALADAVLVGAGTLRAEGGQPWSPRRISPAHADAYASLDRPDPLPVVPTASGHLDPGEARPGLVEGIEFLPEAARRATLLSVRSHGSHLFLHYRLERARAAAADRKPRARHASPPTGIRSSAPGRSRR